MPAWVCYFVLCFYFHWAFYSTSLKFIFQFFFLLLLLGEGAEGCYFSILEVILCYRALREFFLCLIPCFTSLEVYVFWQWEDRLNSHHTTGTVFCVPPLSPEATYGLTLHSGLLVTNSFLGHVVIGRQDKSWSWFFFKLGNIFLCKHFLSHFWRLLYSQWFLFLTLRRE